MRLLRYLRMLTAEGGNDRQARLDVSAGLEVESGWDERLVGPSCWNPSIALTRTT